MTNGGCGIDTLSREIKSTSVLHVKRNLHLTPSDPCPTDLDRILTEGQDPDAQQYLVLGTVPIKGKNLGFWAPMHLLY